MKDFALILLLLFCINEIRAEDKPVVFTFTTTEGKTYNDAIVMRLETDAVQIRHAGGITRIPIDQLPANLRTKAEAARKKMVNAAEEGIEVQETYDIHRSVELLSGPSPAASKLINHKATNALGGIHYLSIDQSCSVRIHQIKDGWAKITVVQPEYLALTHSGWIPATALKRGTASQKLSGWIRKTTKLFTDAEGTTPYPGIIIQKAAVSVSDSDENFLELNILTAPIRTADQSGFVENEKIQGKLYIPREYFTTEAPNTW